MKKNSSHTLNCSHSGRGSDVTWLAAFMIRRIVDGNMGQAIWRETVLKGFDPREFVLFAFGGAGPTQRQPQAPRRLRGN